LHAADWPTYRADAARSGYTPQELPRELVLRWSFQPLHAPQPAWRGPAAEPKPSSTTASRLTFDRAFHVAIGDGKLFFGSSADCHVYALDAASGRELWSFCTDGPVRFVPTVWRETVFAVSDDGYLYALAAADGKLRWKRRGGPEDDLLLGNDRLVSRWPVRGAPVVSGDVLYFAAGIWPSEGIYLYALDPATGRVLWRNDDSGSLYMPQPHGGANAYSGVAAQGYLALAGERLLVPTGRAVPAAFKANGGKFDYFHLQKYGHQGGADLLLADRGDGSLAFINSGWLYDAKTGDGLQKLGPGALAATPTGIIHGAATGLTSYRWADIVTKDRRGNELKFRGLAQQFVVPSRGARGPRATEPGKTQEANAKPSSVPPVGAMGIPHALVVADKEAVLGGDDAVTVIDLEKKEPRQTLKVDGAAHGLAVADGRLYVSTDTGMIYCFAAEGGGVRHQALATTVSHYGENARYADAAAEIVKSSGITEGYCVDLACGDGGLAYELAKRTKLQIYAIDADEKNVAAARAKLMTAGLYGVRVTVHQASPEKTPYPNHFANLVVSARSVIGGPAVVPSHEAERLQRPSGGVACLGKPSAMKTTTRGPLAGAGAWTHQYANAANTSCSDDKLLKGRLRILWYRDADFEVPQRHGRAPAPLSLDGRVFHEGMSSLRAADAYNGRTLWEYPLPGVLKPYNADHLMGTSGTGSNLCAAGDSVYVALPDRCLRIAAADGKKLADFPAPKQADGKPGRWGYLACEGGALLGSLVDSRHVVTHTWQPADMSELFTESTMLFALDAKTGEPRWTYRAKHSIRHNAIAIGGGRVYLIDRPQAESDRLRRRGEKAPTERQPGTFGNVPHAPGVLVAFDLATGREAWRQEENVYGTVLALSTKHDVLLMSYQPTRFKLPSEVGGRLAAFRASDGRRLWDREAKYQTRPVINDAQVLAHGGAWDLLTGEPREFGLKDKSYGCGQFAACESMLFYRSATLGYFDLSASSEGTKNFGGIRPGCWINAIPAGGILLVPDAASGCVCSYLNQAWFALESAR
jgi:outer membrane protein assembly factor BamB